MSERATISVNVGGVSRSKTITRDGTVFTHSETPAYGINGTLSTRTDENTGVITLVTTWAADTAYAYGDLVIPSTPNTHTYRCTTAGTSDDSTEPTWVTDGTTNTDGTATWTDIGTNGHGITDANKVDVGWVDANGLNQNRTRMTVSSADGTTITVDGGAGTNFPTEDYAVCAGKRSSVSFAATGASVKLLSLYSEPPAGVTLSRAVADFVTSVPATIKAFDLGNDEPFVWANNSPIANPVTGSTIAAIELSSLTAYAPTVYIECVYDASP